MGPFLNPALLLGLVGIALPVVAHLLSRQKFDVVEWGAMQFLELGHRTRRRIRLEELLLLLLRMLMIALVALALCRPFVTGGWLARWLSHQSRDVVLVLDGSYSMGWEGKAVTPHAAAIQWAHGFLETLGPGDTVAVLDARDRVRPIIDTPTTDLAVIRKELEALPNPSGTSDIPEAISHGVRILGKGSNLAREVVVITDGQARGWSAVDLARWELLDDLQTQQTIKPRLWVIGVGDGAKGDRTNFALDRPELSREFAAVNLPVRIRTKVRYTGGQAPLQRRVWLEADGQRLAEASLQTPMLAPGSEFPVEFEHRFATVGSHRLSVVLDADNLPGDNRAEAAITVAEAIPVLLVDGETHLDPTRSESFFAKAALSASGNDSPLVKATVITPDKLTSELLDTTQTVALLNVSQLTAAQADAVMTYVAAGGGLLVAAGEQVNAQPYNTLLFGDGDRVLPASFEKIETDTAQPPAPGVGILDGSLKLPLVTSLRRENDGGFTDARFTKWWSVTLAPPRSEDAPEPPPGVAVPRAGEPIVGARLSTNAPYLLLRTYGRGRVAQITAPLDSDWSTLPAKPDYVAFLHELVFHLAGGAAPSRNVMIGEPLVLPVAKGTQAQGFVFKDPAGKDHEAELGGDEARPVLQFDQADLPGLYRLLPKEQAANAAAVGEQFVVEFDRGESDLKPLDDAARKQLAGEGRLKFVQNLDELTTEFYTGGPKSEIWRVLMALLLAFLVGELLLTRRLVQGGHERTVAEPEADDLAQAA